jgi:hypothetical protein
LWLLAVAEVVGEILLLVLALVACFTQPQHQSLKEIYIQLLLVLVVRVEQVVL